jgi:hypothetical protein
MAGHHRRSEVPPKRQSREAGQVTRLIATLALRTGIAPSLLCDTDPAIVDEMIRQLNKQDKEAEKARR